MRRKRSLWLRGDCGQGTTATSNARRRLDSVGGDPTNENQQALRQIKSETGVHKRLLVQRSSAVPPRLLAIRPSRSMLKTSFQTLRNFAGFSWNLAHHCPPYDSRQVFPALPSPIQPATVLWRAPSQATK